MIWDRRVADEGANVDPGRFDLRLQMRLSYPRGFRSNQLCDAGRVRYDPFFRKMYGESEIEVFNRLATVDWLPSSVNLPVLIHTANGIADRLRALAGQLDALPEYHRFIDRPAGTFWWRNIRDTDRLSVHSYGIAMDLNVNQAHYWKWDEQLGRPLTRRSNFPMELVRMFEAQGFIWGGKWRHYDTMHFEYRPELLL